MDTSTAELARSITRKSSKQTYYTACLMVDKDLKDDFSEFIKRMKELGRLYMLIN